MSEHFIIQIPKLLERFQMDTDKIINLLQIPRYFDLEHYTSNRLESHLDLLLEQITTIIDKHTHADVSNTCVVVTYTGCLRTDVRALLIKLKICCCQKDLKLRIKITEFGFLNNRKLIYAKMSADWETVFNWSVLFH